MVSRMHICYERYSNRHYKRESRNYPLLKVRLGVTAYYEKSNSDFEGREYRKSAKYNVITRSTDFDNWYSLETDEPKRLIYDENSDPSNLVLEEVFHQK